MQHEKLIVICTIVRDITVLQWSWIGKEVEMTNEIFRVVVGLVVIVMVVLIPTVLVLAVQEMTPERATYIYNVCTRRFLIDDMSVSGYCTGIMLCLQYKTAIECYNDLKNGEISDM
jgi:hypothetical protein